MNALFYNDPDLSEHNLIAICAEDMITNIGKFYLPALTPFLNRDKIYDKTDIEYKINNILNELDNNISISPCNTSNYIELKTPDNILGKQGDKFIIGFLEKDIQKPFIIGRYIE